MKESPIRTERKPIHLPPDTIQALNKLAARNGTDFSKEVRRAIDEYLDWESTAENIDMISGIIQQELSGQIKGLGNRLAGLINHLAIISVAGYYAHIGYIATRPGAVKNEGMRHGLFGKLEPGEVREFDSWQEAARMVRELSYRRVNMYRGIISFSPETAVELGLTDHKAWEDYMERHILTLARYNGIRVQNLQRVAAHHNERGHPHIHVVFWDKNQRTMVPFVHPSIPDKIRRQLIRDTFVDKIQAYCEAKQRARERLTNAAVDLVDEFEQYMEQLHPSEYKRLRETFGHITDDELGVASLDGVLSADGLTRFIPGLFALKEKMPKKGRLAYKLLPEEVKAELDAFIGSLKTDCKYIGDLVNEYADAKCQLAIHYDTDSAHVEE